MPCLARGAAIVFRVPVNGICTFEANLRQVPAAHTRSATVSVLGDVLPLSTSRSYGVFPVWEAAAWPLLPVTREPHT